MYVLENDCEINISTVIARIIVHREAFGKMPQYWGVRVPFHQICALRLCYQDVKAITTDEATNMWPSPLMLSYVARQVWCATKMRRREVAMRGRCLVQARRCINRKKGKCGEPYGGRQRRGPSPALPPVARIHTTPLDYASIHTENIALL